MNNNKAKEIFFQYDGRHFFMWHEGIWDEYKKYNIDEITEENWRKELINLRLKDFKQTSKIRYLIPIVEYYNKYDLLDELLSVKIKGTYINSLVMIELLTKLMYKNKNKVENFKDKKAIIVKFFSTFIEEKIPKKYEAYNVEERIKEIKAKLKTKQ